MDTKNGNTFLSIIIPVYNGIPYIQKLISSIISQEHEDFSYEVIIIDDGSNDGTEQYCNDLKKEFSNFRIVHQKNSGSPAGPRNLGISMAEGEYIFFADADDYFLPGAFKNFVFHAKKSKCEIGLFKVDGTDWDYDYGGLFDEAKDNCTIYNSKIMNSLGVYKLYKKSFLIDNNLTFPEAMHFEDLSFNVECYLNASNIIIRNDQTYYKYTKRDDKKSLSQELSSSEYFTKASYKLTGLENYLNVSLKYCTSENNPLVFFRAFRYAIDKVLIDNIDNISLVNKIKSMLAPHYCDALRSVMPLRLLLISDSLILSDYNVMKKIISSYPDGPIIRWQTNNNDSISYKILTMDNSTLLSGTIPSDCGFGREKLESPNIFRTVVSHASVHNDCITFKGTSEILQNSNGIISKGLLRAQSSDSPAVYNEISISNVSCIKAYANVYHYTFEWEGKIHFSDIEKLNPYNKKCIAHFYLDIMLDDDHWVHNRFGHNRKLGVFTEFIQNAAIYNNILIAPTETNYKNISVNLIPIDMISQTPIRINHKSRRLLRNYLSLHGNLGFDNYKCDILTFTVLDTDNKRIIKEKVIKKGNSRSSRNFHASFSLPLHLDLTRLCYSVSIRVLNGKIEYENITTEGIHS